MNLISLVFALCLGSSITYGQQCDSTDASCSSGLSAASDDAATVSSNFKMEHGFGWDNTNLISRGDLLVSRDGDTSIKLKFSEKSIELPITVEMVTAVKQKLPYRVKISISEDISDENLYLLSSVDACEVAAADFKFNFIFHLSNLGELLAFSVAPYIAADKVESTPREDCASEEFRASLASSLNKKLVAGESVTVRSKASASVPTEDHLAPVEITNQNPLDASQAGGAASELFDDAKPKADDGEEGEESQSFLRKYWYIFLPMFVMSFLGGPQEQPDQQAVAEGAKGKRKGGKKK